MKVLVNIARVVVGLLFMFSGFIKMIDPIGFSYKLQQYFSPLVFDLSFLEPYTLIIAVVIVIFEVLIGLMLLLGYGKNFTRWALLVVSLFFTILTFYTAVFEKVTDCGCFGDAIALTPWESFSKNLVLLALVVFIFLKYRYIVPIYKVQTNKWIVFWSVIVCLGLTYRTLMHLPIFDFRPYKIGNNLKEEMIAEDGEIPAIHDFYIMKNGQDITDSVLNKAQVVFVTVHNIDESSEESWEAVKKATDRALEKGYDVIGLTSSGRKAAKAIKEQYDLAFNFLLMDATTIKTMIRSNPGLLILHNGTVTQKAHWRDTEDLEFNVPSSTKKENTNR